jgi:hypothetical protein
VIDLELRAPTQLASSRARIYWTVRALPGWIAVALVETLALLGATAGVVIPVVAVSAALAFGHLAVMPQWRYRVHRWEITDAAVYTQTGWFTQERRIAPMARIQTADTHRGPIEQLFGLANVTVTTASAKGPLKIHALDLGVAERIVEHLTHRAQLSAEDGT